jgi:thioredoxin-like negative regulator of GroEL
VNASYDWHLTVPLLLDANSRLARQLQVNSIPTTFLFAADGRILKRWQGLTRPAVLAQGIERLLGGPLGQTAPQYISP